MSLEYTCNKCGKKTSNQYSVKAFSYVNGKQEYTFIHLCIEDARKLEEVITKAEAEFLGEDIISNFRPATNVWVA